MSPVAAGPGRSPGVGAASPSAEKRQCHYPGVAAVVETGRSLPWEVGLKVQTRCPSKIWVPSPTLLVYSS